MVRFNESLTSFVCILRSNVKLVSLKSTRSNSSKPESSKQSSSKPFVPWNERLMRIKMKF
jgi:hypothetical protein